MLCHWDLLHSLGDLLRSGLLGLDRSKVMLKGLRKLFTYVGNVAKCNVHSAIKMYYLQ